jgi:hypothetical protein
MKRFQGSKGMMRGGIYMLLVEDKRGKFLVKK